MHMPVQKPCLQGIFLLSTLQSYKGICKIICSIIWGSYIKTKSSLKTLLKTQVYRASTSFSLWAREAGLQDKYKTQLSFSLLALWGFDIFIVLSSSFYAYGLIGHSFLMVQKLNLSLMIHKSAGRELFSFIHSKEVSRILGFVIDPPSREEAELLQSSRNMICAYFCNS